VEYHFGRKLSTIVHMVQADRSGMARRKDSDE
jgi:hypothetical protein